MLGDLKKNKPLLLFFLIFYSLAVNAQPKPTSQKFIIAEKTLTEGLRKNDSSMIGDGYYLLGKAYEAEFDYPNSYESFYNALDVFRKRKEWYNAGRVYLRLTDCELAQRRIKEAKSMLNEALNIFQVHNIEQGIRDVYFLSGMIHCQAFNPEPNNDSALYYFRKLEVTYSKLKDDINLARVRGNIGIIYSTMNDKRAVPNLEYTIRIKQKEPPDSPLLGFRSRLAGAYLSLGDLKNTRKVLDESQILIDQKHKFNMYALALHHETFANYYKALEDWKNAYAHREKYLSYQKNLIDSDRDGNISKWRIRLETEKKDLELKLQKSELENNQRLINQQRYLLIATVIFLSIVGVMMFFLYKNYQKQKLLSDHNAILIQEQNHRVKNNLQIISSLLSLQSNQLEEPEARQAVDESQLRIEAMAVLHRQLYDTKQLDKIDMDVFINNLSAIILESYGLDEIELDYQINIRPIEADKAVFLGLMINEFISNACKHAFAEHPSPILQIRLSENKNQITLQIIDNGIKPIDTLKKESFGMKLINMMVRQLDGQLSYQFNSGSVFTVIIN